MRGARDGVALTLGVVSVVSWGVAEVPQIVSNYREKSTEGLSIAFLATWIVGDILNLVGCFLEPATLPTQFYTALLYTVTTVILTVQTVYYGHIYHWLKAKKSSHLDKSHKLQEEDDKLLYRIEEIEHKTGYYEANGSISAEGGHNTASLPIPVSAQVSHHYGSVGRELYYMSARSLSKSPVPTWSARTPVFTHDQHSSREPLIGRRVPAQSAPPANTKNMLCVVSSAAFLLCTYGYNLSIKHTVDTSSHGMIISFGRKLLQSDVAALSVEHGGGSSEIGSFLGWAMAAIYVGGRLPQIYLNIRRGNVEGLSPLMFIFALIGNATYVGSILVNSLEWSKIGPNMPWLVDAGGCVLLDAFILIQFAYFRYWKTKDIESRVDL